jgi:pimeloyl-ACP methyl ester carboxylesterase
LPGHGKSTEPAESLYADDFARITITVLGKLNVKDPILIGHSNGGRTILSMVGRMRYTAKKIVLIDSAGIKPHRSISYYLKVYSFKAVKRLAYLLLNEQKAATLVERYRRKAGSDDYNAASPVMRATLSNLVNDDLAPCLPKINAPTLLIWGDNDDATPLSDGKLMESRIPDAGLVVLKGCGHFSYLEKPYDVNVILDKFLGNAE